MPWRTETRAGVMVATMTTSPSNAINDFFLDDLERVTAAVRAHAPPLRGLVLTGSPARPGKTGVFSSGLDLLRNFNDRAFTARFIARYERAMVDVLTLPCITVAALNGHALAGGCVLALACDFRVALGSGVAGGKGARIGVNEVLNGVPFPPATTEIVCNALPRRAARLALYAGFMWTPETALADGAVDRLVRDDAANLVPMARAICELLPEGSASAVSGNKRVVLGTTLRSIGAAVDATDGAGGYKEFLDAVYSEHTQAMFAAIRRQMAAKRKAASDDAGGGGVATAAGAGAGAGTGAGAGAGAGDLLRDTGDFRFQVLQQHHVPQTIDCLVEVWAGENVIMRSLHVTHDEFRPLAKKRVEDAAKLGLSVVVTQVSTGAVVGFFLWEDMSASAWNEKLDISTKFEPQFKFMSELEGMYTASRPPLRKGEVLHGIYGGVLSTVSGRHLTTQLLDLSAVLAERHGFKFMVTEAVVVGSQQISFKLGWKDVALKQYSTFEFRGRFPFGETALIAKTPCAVLFELPLPRPRAKL